MSLGIYPVFEPQLLGDKFDALGEILASNIGALDEIARVARLTPLSALLDNRRIPDDFEGCPDELAEILGERTEWFDPAEVQFTIRALVGHIQTIPGLAGSIQGGGEVCAELEELARVLGVAVSQGSRFRLELI